MSWQDRWVLVLSRWLWIGPLSIYWMVGLALAVNFAFGDSVAGSSVIVLVGVLCWFCWAGLLVNAMLGRKWWIAGAGLAGIAAFLATPRVHWVADDWRFANNRASYQPAVDRALAVNSKFEVLDDWSTVPVWYSDLPQLHLVVYDRDDVFSSSYPAKPPADLLDPRQPIGRQINQQWQSYRITRLGGHFYSLYFSL